MANQIVLLLLLNINIAGMISLQVRAPVHVPITIKVVLLCNVNTRCYIPLPSSTTRLTLVTKYRSCIRTTLN